MHKILFVIPSLDYGGAVKQLALLAAGLPRDRFETRVCTLGPSGPMHNVLTAAEVPVDCLDWTRPIDVRPLWRLRRLVRTFQPDIIHAWRLPALRAVRLAVGRSSKPSPCRIVASAFLTRRKDDSVNVLDRWLLQRTDRVTVMGEAEAERCRRMGMPSDRIAVIPPGVATAPEELGTTEELLRALSPAIPPAARLLACVGPLEPHKGFREAIWTFDILKYLYNDLQLLLIGDGPDRPRLKQFIDDMEVRGRAHLVGCQPDAAALLRAAEIVWIPNRSAGGVNTALEAMAAGKPVIASRLPELAEIVVDGETGFLVPPGDKATLARQTRMLLDDAERRRRLGETGRQRAARCFAAAEMLRRFVELYEGGRMKDEG